MIICGNDAKGISNLKSHLMSTFMKDLGSLTYFLGLEVSRSKAGIWVNQTKYADDLIKSARLNDAKSFNTPFELNVKINKDDGSLLEDPTIFRWLVGSLLYLTMIRLDISHALHTVSKYVSNPHKIASSCCRSYPTIFKRNSWTWFSLPLIILSLVASLC